MSPDSSVTYLSDRSERQDELQTFVNGVHGVGRESANALRQQLAIQGIELRNIHYRRLGKTGLHLSDAEISRRIRKSKI